MRAVVGAGKYRYRHAEDWAKWPTHLPAAEVTSVAVDANDHVWACRAKLVDGVAQRVDPPIVRFDTDGQLLASWGNGALVFPHALHVANDRLCVVDRDRSICIVFDFDGRPELLLGRPGVHSDTGIHSYGRVEAGLQPHAAGPFNYPAKMILSPWGDYYVADGHRNARVHRFDSGGHLIQSWGIWGRSAPGEFNRPHSVLIGRDRRVYVCDRDNDRIQIFTRNGEFVMMWADDLIGPSDIAQLPDGAFVIGEAIDATLPATHRMTVLNDEGQVVARWSTRDSHGVAVDSSGAIYISLMVAKGVDKYEPC